MRELCRAGFVRWFLLPFTLVLWVGITSCTHWSEPRSPVRSIIQEKQPDRIRVTTADGSVTKLQAPRIESDTLIGRGWTGPTIGAAQTLRIPLTDVRRVEIRSVNTAGTLLAVAGVALLGVAVIGAATVDPL